ncbi:hypothetical protein ASPZODRAFT_74044 [Penicilliopsis zonata CBS 506.65]|uniref:Uncharacterized protein n=1 Tax=Penicilliopsis zonata CBS 506.65 TaxID=1073090 RepID=A0A1L9S8Y8_9EURO|nr:hypothetical protein ASPZODRAFT_74044 [Penicilliopsis zonata CBS 506.65]OJJ43614.1 hypothetical protein ASPZODRAFT_74044 [Penicilliopsis zonata CBS 506.65]
MAVALATLASLALTLAQAVSPLVSQPGDRSALAGWNMQSILDASQNMTQLSLPGAVDVSSWYRVGARSTVMAGLIENGVFSDEQLFYSDTLATGVDSTPFTAPWLYREEFEIEYSPQPGEHVFLDTHGITSKASLFVNGVCIASHAFHQGSYGGHRYEITAYLREGVNVVLVKAYPTNYLRDFAMGFVDWNPYPPDNGTGVWRDVEIVQTGAVSLSAPRITTDYEAANIQPDELAHNVTVTVKVDVVNHEDSPITARIQGTISDDNAQVAVAEHSVQLAAHEETTVSLAARLEDVRVWWPRQWGEQPLYSVTVNASIADTLSDVSPVRQFGVRQVTATLNAHNDTAFTVNGHPFLVLGAGYSPDLFMRWDAARVDSIFRYVLDMGLNTVRLEGKQEHPELYEMADRMGVMLLAGWECCDKWEGWSYNDDAPGYKWTEHDYTVANASMLHEAAMMQTHPSLLGFLVGSDVWPDDRATQVYVSALERMDWATPIVASASMRGWPDQLGPSGMKMEGPYDWVPPNYWYAGDGQQFLGAAFGFGSEQGAGVGTPERASLQRFLSEGDLDALWREPDAGLFHMSTNVSQFYDRSIYNEGLFARYGKPTSLDEYVLKAQMMDYEATRAEFEAFAALQNAERPATGVIYWMLNAAWPNLHWQLFDYYLQPAGAYFGTKTGSRHEHVAYNYQDGSVYLINRGLRTGGNRSVTIDLIDRKGKSLLMQQHITNVTSTPNTSGRIGTVSGLDRIKDIAFLRLLLKSEDDDHDGGDTIISRNVYWLGRSVDELDWENSTWYSTPVTSYTDLRATMKLSRATLRADMVETERGSDFAAKIVLDNESDVPALFVRMVLLHAATGEEIVPVSWSDNYLTLFPGERLEVEVEADVGDMKLDDMRVEVAGVNVKKFSLV